MNVEEYERAQDAHFAWLWADARMVERGVPLADAIEKGNPVSDLMDDLTTRLDAVGGECKIDGCTEPYVTQKGMYGRLCADHVEALKEERAAEASRSAGLRAELTETEPTVPPFAAAVVRMQQARAEFVAARKALVALVGELTDVGEEVV